MRNTSFATGPHLAIASYFCLLAACAGDQHRSTGEFQLTLRGGVNAQVSGVATGQYAHQFSSSGKGYSIWLPFSPSPSVFGSDEGGGLVFSIDSLPTPGRYELESKLGGRRSTRTIAAVLGSGSGVHLLVPGDGVIEFLKATTPNGILARFAFRVVRMRGAPDTTEINGTIDLRDERQR